MSIHNLSQNPAALGMLAFAWACCLLAGLTFVWQALFHRARPGGSKLAGILKGIVFRFRLAAGLGLLALAVYGLVWAASHW